MDKYPIKIKNSPLLETICEIRFNTDFPSEAIIGVIFQSVLPLLNNPKIINLPLSQMPIEARRNIPEVDYQQLYQINNDCFVIGVGARVITFSQRKPYTGWDRYSKFILDAMRKLIDNKFFKNITRIGLRYINLLDDSLLEVTNFKMSFLGKTVSSATTSMTRLEDRINDSLVIVFNLNNNVLVGFNNQKPKKSSMIDINAVQEISILLTEEDNHVLFANSINKLHSIVNNRFFDLLNDSFLKSLEPVYN